VMNVLCGEKELPYKPGVFIKDRSVHPEKTQRDLALDYLEYVVNNMKFEVPVKAERQGFLYKNNIIMSNFVVTVEGTEVKDKVVIIGAHYDVQNNLSHCWRGCSGSYTVTSGADDNTSGVVGCLALLRRMSISPPLRTVQIVCFDGEEPGQYCGMAVGSNHFVKQLGQSPLVSSVTSAVIVDMIGGPPTVPDVGFVISTSMQVDDDGLSNILNNSFNFPPMITVANKESSLNCLDLSDSLHFQRLNIPTVLLANVAGYASVPYFYHTEEDTVKIIDWDSFLYALDILHFMSKMDLPKQKTEEVKVDEEKLKILVDMGFPSETARVALLVKKNNLDAALEELF